MKPSVKGHIAGILFSLILIMVIASVILWPSAVLEAIIVAIAVFCLGIIYWIAYNMVQPKGPPPWE